MFGGNTGKKGDFYMMFRGNKRRKNMMFRGKKGKVKDLYVMFRGNKGKKKGLTCDV